MGGGRIALGYAKWGKNQCATFQDALFVATPPVAQFLPSVLEGPIEARPLPGSYFRCLAGAWKFLREARRQTLK
jgi:hypothetical protein